MVFANLNAEIAKHSMRKIDLAKKLGISINTLSLKINCKQEFKLDEVVKLLKLFPDTTMDYLFTKTEKTKK